MVDDDTNDVVMEDVTGDDGENEEPKSSDDDAESSESEAEPVLAVSRTRRSNAGNRMSKLLELAELEDAQQEEEYGEIFKESADDVEFEAQDGEEEDVNMDSSSEDEDAEAQQDEDAGEKELKSQERKDRTKKRKRESLLQDAMKRAAARVGPKMAPPISASASSPTSSEAAPIRSRKKSERVSWLPESSDFGPIRASSRSLAVQNKSAIHERLKEKEKHRLKTLAIMRAAEKRKDADKPKTLTQEERLEEAARVERLNSKSLNRWEAAERKRVEEQKARLAALKDHRLEGPIITYYSGPSLWINDRLKAVGKDALVQEVTDKPSTADAMDTTEDGEADRPAPAVQPVDGQSSKPVDGLLPSPSQKSNVSEPHPSRLTQSPQATKSMDLPMNGGFLEGIEEYANASPESKKETHTHAPFVFNAHTIDHTATPATPKAETSIVEYETPGFNRPPDNSLATQTLAPTMNTNSQSTFPATPLPQQQAPPSQPLPPLPKAPQRRELACRVLITLRDFPTENLNPNKKEPDWIKHQLLGWPLTPATTTIEKKKEKAVAKELANKKAICAVTGQPARYQDPTTGLFYADANALKSMRWVINGTKGRWSPSMGVFAQPTDPTAKGRPAKSRVSELFSMDNETLLKRRQDWLKRREEERIRREAQLKAEAEERARQDKIRAEQRERMLQHQLHVQHNHAAWHVNTQVPGSYRPPQPQSQVPPPPPPTHVQPGQVYQPPPVTSAVQTAPQVQAQAHVPSRPVEAQGSPKVP